jgi:hypothetical protein
MRLFGDSECGESCKSGISRSGENIRQQNDNHQEALISNWPAVFLQYLTAASKLSHSVSDSAEQSLVGEMIMAASEWYGIAEEALFIQHLLCVLDDPAQKSVTAIVQDRLAKMFQKSHARLSALAVAVDRGDTPRFLQEAQDLWDRGERFVKKLGEGVTQTRS